MVSDVHCGWPSRAPQCDFRAPGGLCSGTVLQLTEVPVSRARLASALTVALLIVPGLALASATATTRGEPLRSVAVEGAPGIGDDYFPIDGNGGYDVRRYDIHDTYSFATRRLSGWTAVTLRSTQELTAFNLDFLLPVSSVRVDGRPAAFSKPLRHELRIVPRDPIPQASTVRVEVRYAGRPDAARYAGESNWLADRGEVVTMNQPHMAPWWFPANDHPLDKARMRIHITVPAGRRVIANGLPAGRDRHGDQVTWHWRAEPMVPYLAYFAAGRFTVERGTAQGLPWLVAVSRRLPASTRPGALTLLRRSPGVVRWLASELGPYPFASTGGLVTSLRPGFALENQTRPVYPLVGPGDVDLVVHELAHQWFGDDVAVARWRDIWLNEGFATYLEKRYLETHGGRSTTAWLRSTYEAISGGSGFWALPISDPGPGSLFDTAVYVRGGMTLAALRSRIGEAEFDTLLRTWAADHSGGNGSTEEFRALAETVSGEELDSFFDAWLVTTSKPMDTPENGLG